MRQLGFTLAMQRIGEGSDVISAPVRTIIRLMLMTSLSVKSSGYVSLALPKRSSSSLVSESFLVL